MRAVPAPPHPGQTSGATAVWHLLLLFALSASYESLFVHHGLNLLDEGWTLFAAKKLHEGGTLYRDVLFVFPPGHLLPAWLGYWWEPPGIVPTRVIDAALNVSLCLALYLLGRRLMPPTFALLGAGLLAVAAPYSHNAHFLFGYRYTVIPVLALLAFSARLRTGRRRFALLAGLLAGLALCFRLTPAFAVSVGIGLGILASSRELRSWLADGSLYAAGVVAAALPVVAWYGARVGLDTFWLEAVVRPVAMTDLQSLPVPPLGLPDTWERRPIGRWFTALQFRSYSVLYVGYVSTLLFLWLRALLRRKPFEHVLLLASVTWGAVYFTRVWGRSDIAHIESALPPVCLLIGHFWSCVCRAVARRRGRAATRPIEWAACAVVTAFWILLFRSDMYAFGDARGWHPMRSTRPTIYLADERRRRVIDNRVEQIRELTTPDQEILDLSASPLFHLLADRGGPSHSGLLMPATFLEPAEEQAFLAKLRASPPAVVIVPRKHFDDRRSRSIEVTAPRVSRWVVRNYQRLHSAPDYVLWVPRRRPGEHTATGARAAP